MQPIQGQEDQLHVRAQRVRPTGANADAARYTDLPPVEIVDVSGLQAAYVDASLRELARKLRIFLHIGSLAIKLSPERAATRSFLIDHDGEIIAR